MDKMTIAKCIDAGIDIIASLLIVYILIAFILKKRKFKKQMEKQESSRTKLS